MMDRQIVQEVVARSEALERFTTPKGGPESATCQAVRICIGILGGLRAQSSRYQLWQRAVLAGGIEVLELVRQVRCEGRGVASPVPYPAFTRLDVARLREAAHELADRRASMADDEFDHAGHAHGPAHLLELADRLEIMLDAHGIGP
jgi:hypothetical protein